MATATVALNVTGNASQQLAKVQKQVDSVGSAFGKLRNILGGLALGSFISNTLRFADSMTDLSDATGIAVGTIVGFNTAVSQAGGDADKAQAAIQKLVLSIGEAAEGSTKTQNAFAKVGVTLDDLAKLSEEDILKKTINGLAQIKDFSQRATLQNELLGKSFRGIDITKVSAGLGAATTEGNKYAAAIKSAGETQDKLELALNNLRIALLDTLKPLADVLKEISANIETVKKFIKVLLTLGSIILTFTAVGKVLKGVEAIMRIFAVTSLSLASVFVKLGDILKGKVAANVLRFAAGLVTAAKNAIIAIPGFRSLMTLIAGLAATAAGAVASLKLFGDETVKSGEDAEEAIRKMNEESMAAHAESNRRAEQEEKNRRTIIDGLAKQAQEIRNVTAAYKDSNDEFVRSLQNEATYISMSNDAAEISKAQEEIYNRAINTIQELQNKKASLTEEEKNLAPIIDQQIKIIEQSIIKDQYRAEQAIKNIQAIRFAQEELNKSIEQQKLDIDYGVAVQGLQEQLALIGQYGEELENNQMILSVTNELQSKLTDYQKQLLDLEKQKGQLTAQQYASELNHINTMITKAYEYADARLEAEQKILEAQRATQENATLGIEQAIADIAKQFEPYTMAQDAVLAGWNKIGSAIDNFVETGKFKFSDFARSVIADFAKMIIKAQIFKALQATLGFFGLPGLAEGGPAKSGQPYIVGEKGPELFVPRQAGTVIPNNKLAMASASTGSDNMVSAPITNNYITNNINALDAKSVAQLFAENRKALLGSVRTAEKELPYRA